jgi:hypothetical protein
LVGFVVTDDLEVFFDTQDSTRKASNFWQNPSVAFVIGGLTDGDERTVQYRRGRRRARGPELERLKERHFLRFPDGRDRQAWRGLTYMRARPKWLRLSSFNQTPAEIVEFVFR